MPEGSESRRARPGVPSTAGGAESAEEVQFCRRTSSPTTSPGWETAVAVGAESGADLASARALRPCPRPKFDFRVRPRSNQTRSERGVAECARRWWVSKWISRMLSRTEYVSFKYTNADTCECTNVRKSITRDRDQKPGYHECCVRSTDRISKRSPVVVRSMRSGYAAALMSVVRNCVAQVARAAS
jgi:hypothetical protein